MRRIATAAALMVVMAAGTATAQPSPWQPEVRTTGGWVFTPGFAGGLGWLSLTNLLGVGPVQPFLNVGGIVALLFGIWMMSLGGKLGRLEKGARESQITVSALMLLSTAGLMISFRSRFWLVSFLLGYALLRAAANQQPTPTP